MEWTAIVGVDHVASSASATTIITRLIVGSREIQQRIEQSCLLQSYKNGIGAPPRAISATTELRVRSARLILWLRIAHLAGLAPSAFKDPQHISRLRRLP